MKHVPTPQSSLITALAVLDELQVQWRDERESKREAERQALASARVDELARRERIRTRALAIAHRKRDVRARRRLASLRREQRELEQMQARVHASTAARLRDARREIEADLRADARGRLGRLAAAGTLGLAGLAFVGAAIFAPLDPSATHSNRDAGEDVDAVGAMQARLDAFAERQAMLAEAHAELVELRASVPAPPVATSEEAPPSEPKRSAPAKGKRKRPKASKPTTKDDAPENKPPPIVLETEGDPLDGIG